MARRGDGLYQRGKTWWLDFRHDGRRHIVRLGKGVSRTVAGEIARVKRGKILTGEAGIGGPKRKDILFDTAAEEFLKWAETNKRPKTTRSYRQCLAQLKRSFAGKRLSEITSFLVEKHRHFRVKGKEEAGTPPAPRSSGGLPRRSVAANRELATLKALFNRCREWKKFEGENPVSQVKLIKEPKGRLRYLEPEEETALLTTSAEPLRTIILVGIHAGLRIQAEALTLRKEDVDLRRRRLTVQAAYAKSGQPRTVELNSVLREALARIMERSPGPYVFAKADGTPYNSIRTAFESACERAGLTDVTPHTLRHTFASRLAMAGVHPRTIQELGGWAELEMLERYVHLSPSHKAEAVERLVVAGNFTTLFTTPETAAVARRSVSAVQ